MSVLARIALVLASMVFLTVLLTGTAGAATGSFGRAPDHVVFVQTDNPAGNTVVAYDRSAAGQLTQAGIYPTGGLGGVLAGSVVDHTASQGALAFDPRHNLLYAVNAGSNTVSVFAVLGDKLALIQVVPSGGTFPVSVAVSGDVVYVLNAENGGALQGYRVVLDHLLPLGGSTRQLGLDASATPQFVNTPGQVAFSPDGSKLIVTTKANGNDIVVFSVGFLGYLWPNPVVNAEPGTVPFAISFDHAGNLVIAEAGTNSLATFALHNDGTVTLLHSVATGQAATCWVAAAGSFFYASNAGSASLTAFQSGPAGQLTALGNTATDPGTVDAAATPDGRFLYVQAGGPGNVDAFRINANGSLTSMGSVTVPAAAGGEGIVAF
jgi:6-phosphogluconolactonase (cycloisomerase 2 family)